MIGGFSFWKMTSRDSPAKKYKNAYTRLQQAFVQQRKLLSNDGWKKVHSSDGVTVFQRPSIHPSGLMMKGVGIVNCSKDEFVPWVVDTTFKRRQLWDPNCTALEDIDRYITKM